MEKIILCVDDETIILNSLVEQLEKNLGNDYIYETAESAEEALQVIGAIKSENGHLVAVISDWLMPDKCGDELLIEIHDDYPDILKILLTGQANEKAIDKAIHQANLFAVVQKPWDAEEIVSIIKTEIG